MTENTMETIAISDATIGAVNEKTINCQGMFKSLVDATSGITGPKLASLDASSFPLPG